MEPTAQGVLSKTPLAHLIVYCVEKKLRGALVLRPEGSDDNASADVLTLVDGWPAKIRIADPVEHLGRILLEIGAIDDAAYNASLMALAAGGLQGQILLQRGLIDATTLERGLRTQIARKLGLLFGRPAATRYAYYDAADFLQRYGGPELFPVDPTPAIFASIRMNPSMAHADAAVERVSSMQLRLRVGVDLSKLDLTRAEAELVAVLKQNPMTPTQLASTGILDPRAAKLLTYGLLLLKMVEPVATTQAAPAVRPGPAATAVAIAAPTASVVAASAVPQPVAAARLGGDPARRAEITAKAKLVEGESYFEILGVAQSSTPEDAKTAYFTLVKRWHPDRLPPELADLRDDVGRVFALMAEAYQVLTDAERRASYLQQVKHGGGTPQDQEEVARVMEATNSFQKADFFLGKGQMAEAEIHATRAIELEPGDADHVALWCWIQANKPDRRESARYEDLVQRLEKALNENPKNERARFYRGMILKLLGRMGEAIRDFREVAEQNPRHTDAVREVRLYSMRHDRDRNNKDEGTGSLLGKFMKKK